MKMELPSCTEIVHPATTNPELEETFSNCSARDKHQSWKGNDEDHPERT
jgi:hypothetical protein